LSPFVVGGAEVKGLAPSDRPREKLDRVGAAGLGDNELVAIVLGGGTRRMSALSVANALLESCGGLHGLLRLCRDDLRHVKGVGAARAAQILAALELGRRSLSRRPTERVQLISPRDVAVFLMPEYGGRAVEQFGVVLLDTRHRVIRTTVVTSGTLDMSAVHPRDVFRHATSASAAAIVLFHNHPSGDPAPSRDDQDLTARMAAAGHLMGIEVLDHLILGDGRYFSFKEGGRL
jgi:DNA repair protein RadC